MKKKIMFIKPALETTAVWDPIRTCSYLGMWFLASHLKEKGHDVRYLDEVVRNNGLNKRQLFRRILEGDKITEIPLDISFEEYHARKMDDYHKMTPKEFVEKYTAFRDGKVTRDMVRTGNSIEDTLSEIEKYQPEFVGIPIIASANHIPSLKLIQAIKERFPRVKIMIGGQHVTAFYNEFAKNPNVDYIFTGDAITNIEDVIEGKRTERVIHGGFQTMDNFPLLDPSIIEENDYPREPTYTYTTQGRKSADYMFSKGCFRKCEFCVAGSQKGNHVTAIDYNKVDEQLRIFKEYGIEEIIVQDDAFLWDRNHVREHLPKILGLMKKYGFYWQNNGGVEFEAIDDFVTEQLIKYNQEGEGRCTSLYVPFNPRAWNKGKSAAGTMSQRYHYNFENLKRLREEAGIYVFSSQIIGTPEDTVEIMESDIELHKKIISEGYLDADLTLTATLLPGTRWYDNNKQNLVNPNDWAGYSLFVSHYGTENIPNPKVMEYFMVKRVKELDKYQRTYNWGTAFPSEKKG